MNTLTSVLRHHDVHDAHRSPDVLEKGVLPKAVSGPEGVLAGWFEPSCAHVTTSFLVGKG